MTDTNLDSNVESDSHLDGSCDAAPAFPQDHKLIDSIANLVDQLQSKEDQYNQVIDNQKVTNEKIDESQSSINSLIDLVESLTHIVQTSIKPNDGFDNDQLPENRDGSTGDQEISAQDEPEPAEEISPHSIWEAQKAALLKGYSDGDEPTGISSQDSAPVDDSSYSQKPANTDPNNDAAGGQWLDTVDPKTDLPVESKEIIELRKKLEDKLRRAEIEISIERAKISRIQQELDQQQTDLRRQVSKHQNQVDGCKETRKKGRWSKFLAGGGKK